MSEVSPSLSQSLDFSTKRMIHEGPLTWKVNKDKQIGERVCPDTCRLMSLVSRPLNHTSVCPSTRDSSAAAVRLPRPSAERPGRPAAAEVSIPLAGWRRRRQRRQQDLLQPSGEAGLAAGPLSSDG